MEQETAELSLMNINYNEIKLTPLLSADNNDSVPSFEPLLFNVLKNV